ncbi:hypothetical protein SDJN03_23345, partial [Cucurbita argyrosperma subsp. sororia]
MQVRRTLATVHHFSLDVFLYSQMLSDTYLPGQLLVAGMVSGETPSTAATVGESSPDSIPFHVGAPVEEKTDRSLDKWTPLKSQKLGTPPKPPPPPPSGFLFTVF